MAIQAPPKMTGSSPKLQHVDITDFKGGYNSFLDEGRLPANTLRLADNMMIDQDGVVKPRWGTAAYSDPLDGVIDLNAKFVKWSQAERQIQEWLLRVADGRVYTCLDGKGWAAADGDILTVSKPATALQIDDRVFIANGHDNLAYYDIDDGRVYTYTPLTTPGAPTATASSDLTSGTRNYGCWYKITAVNDVGETAASESVNIMVNTMRPSWQNTTGSAAKAQSVTLSWTEVENAVRYNIYYGDADGQECYIDSTASTSYNDDARTQPNITIAAPLDDTTGGPKMSVISYSDNRMWGTGDPDNPYRVYWGGVGQNTTAFSPFFGGGWVDIAKGSGEIPVKIASYRDGKGEGVNTCFMTTADGHGSQQQITLSTMTVGTTTFVVPEIARVIGSFGTASADGIVEAQNNLFFPNPQGFYTTGAKPEMLNVLSTDEIGLAVRSETLRISNHNARLISAIFYEGKIFWAVPYGDDYNNEIWLLDLEIKTWMRPWRIAAKQLMNYTGSDGVNRLLYQPSTGDESRLMEIAARHNTDQGQPFDWRLKTGLINWDKTHMAFERIKKVYFEFLRATGQLAIGIYGSPKNKQLKLLKLWRTGSTAEPSHAGFDDEAFNTARFNEADYIPVAISYASLKKVLKIRKTLNNIQIELSGDSLTSFALSVISIQGIAKQVSDPSEWKK